MTGLKEKRPDQKGRRSEIQDEALIEKILEGLDSIACDNVSRKRIEEMKSDLKELKSNFVESDFKVRYLQSREKALQQFIDDFPSMLGYWKKDLTNLHSNNVYAEYFGKTPIDIRGKHIRELLGEKIFQLNLPYVKNVLEGVPQTFERAIPTPDGKVRHTLASYVPHHVDSGVAGFFVLVTDISEKKALEEKSKNLEALLQDQSKLSALGQMASGVAHEINNPLAIIYSNACILSKEIQSSEFDKVSAIARISEIESTALRIEKIVDGLRSITTGKALEEPEDFDIAEIIDQTLAICVGRFARSNVSIVWEPPIQPVKVRCRKVQISEIILNILNNALDALKVVQHGSVLIAVRKSDDECRISIGNDGSPISDDDRKKIFLPFFTTKGKGGTGLGLKISKDLALANQGNLILSASEATEFILTLKLATKSKVRPENVAKSSKGLAT